MHDIKNVLNLLLPYSPGGLPLEVRFISFYYYIVTKWYQEPTILHSLISLMAEGTRVNQLQEGLNSLKKANEFESQFRMVETKMLALKSQIEVVVQ